MRELTEFPQQREGPAQPSAFVGPRRILDWGQAYSLARGLMDAFGLEGWAFGFDRAKRRAGACHWRKQRITLSSHYVLHNYEEEVRDTILHEIAHALAGQAAGHGPAWRAMCCRVGAVPQRCYDKSVVMPKGRWQAVCLGCGMVFHAHRRPTRRYWCKRCGMDRGLLTYRETV